MIVADPGFREASAPRPAHCYRDRNGVAAQLVHCSSAVSHHFVTSAMPDTTGRHAAAPMPVIPPLLLRLLLLSTYLLYVVVNTVSAALMPSMSSHIGFSSGTAATIAAGGTAAQMLGKMFWGGWPVSAFGGTRTYAFTMLLIGTLVLGYTLAGSAGFLGAVVFSVEFFSTTAYACHVQIIKGHWSEAGRPDGFWLLGVGSRSGDVLSKLWWGWLVGALDSRTVTGSQSDGVGGTSSWRLVCFVAFGVACAAAALALTQHGDSKHVKFLKQQEALTPEATLRIVKGFVQMRMFWVAAAAYSCTTMVKRSNEQL